MLVHPLPRYGLRLLFALALASVVGVFAPVAHDASAKAPPLAMTVLDTEALTEPGYDAASTVVIPQATEVELTGEAAPGFLAVYYDGEAVWVPAEHLSLGNQPGIDTSVTLMDTPLLDAPMPDALVLEIILKEQAVILTGADVGGYDAAAHDGTAGWIDERDLLQ